MGFINDIGVRIEKFWQKDKEVQATKLARGNTSARLASDGGYGYGQLTDFASFLSPETDLLSRYGDYEQMNQYPELAAVLDIFADDSTQTDSQNNKTVWVTAKDESIQTILTNMLHKNLRIDDEMWEIARTLVMYGNDFEELLVTNEGVVGLNFLPSVSVRRIEDCYGALLGFIQSYSGKVSYSHQEFDVLMDERQKALKKDCIDGRAVVVPEAVAFEDWEVVHFRLRGAVRRSIYGQSILEPARWIWNRLRMLEDSAILFRLQKAIERYAFYVDVGSMPAQEALAYVNRIRQQYRKKRYVNPTTGKLELSFDPATPDEDFFIPAREGRDSTRIDVVSAPQWQHMDDIEYFRDKLFSAVKVPKAYLGQEQDVNRATLSGQDVQFARSVLRVQRELKNGLRKICRVHLAALKIDPVNTEYELWMTVPSAIFELAQIEVRAARADLADRMAEFVSLRWTLRNIFGMSDQEIETVIEERGEDVKRVARTGAEGEKIAASLLPAQEDATALTAAKTLKQLQENVRIRNKKEGYAGRITRSEMDRGDRDSEARASEKLDSLLRSDKVLANRLVRVQSLLEELRDVQRTKRSD